MKDNNRTNYNELDLFMEKFKKDDIAIPKDFDRKVEEKIDSLQPIKSHSIAKTLIVSGLCIMILLLGSIRFNTKVYTYASEISILKPIVDWIRGIDSGIENADEHRYPMIKAVNSSQDGYDIKLDNMFLDEDRFFVTVEIKGEEVSKLSREYSDLSIEGEFKVDGYPSYGKIFPRYMDGTKGDRLLASFEVNFVNGSLNMFEDSFATGIVNLKIKNFNYEKKEHKILHTFKPIEVSMDKSNILKSKIYPVDGNLSYIAGEFKLKSLRVSPTRMNLKLRMDEKKNYNFKAFENFYLKDNEDKIYKPEGMISRVSGRTINSNRNIELYFVPSIYFDETPRELYLHIDGLRYDLTDESIVKLDLNDNYPMKKIYTREEIIFSKPKRNDEGHLVVEFEVRDSEEFQYINLDIPVNRQDGKLISRERNKIKKDDKEILQCRFVYDIPKKDDYEFYINGRGYFQREEVDIPINLNN